MWVSITHDGKVGYQTKVSRLVAETFLGLKNDQVVIHRNRNKDDNDISNLLVVSKKELGEITGHLSKGWAIGKFNTNGVLIKKYKSVRAAAIDEGVSYQTLLDHINGKTKVNKYSNYKRIYKKKRRVEE